jgi:hypothetical protein
MTLQGKYRALGEQMMLRANELSAASARIASLENLVATMQSAPPPRQPEPSPETYDDDDEFARTARNIVRKENETLRADLSRAMGTITQLQTQLQRMNGGIAPVLSQVVQEQRRVAQGEFLSRMKQALPQWEATRMSPAFAVWLEKIDPKTGISNQTYWNDAVNKLDVARTVSILTEFSSASPPVAPSPASGVSKPLTEGLEKFVAPGKDRAASPAASAPASPRTWSSPDIGKFYDDKLKGRLHLSKEEITALERDIFDAVREGRVK